MFQDAALLKKRHRRFITTVCASEQVFALKDRKGFATSSSNYYDDENGNPVWMICFWAEKALATSCIIEEWKTYKIEEIQLSTFLENWCIGMEIDGLIVGTEFDQNMFGYESEPLHLILEIVQELKAINKEISLKKFDTIFDLEKLINTILE